MFRLTLLGLLAFTLQPLASVQAEAKRYALLVGINEYDHGKLHKLDFAVDDAAETAAFLGEHGYHKTLLTDKTEKQPTKKNIEAALDEILGKFQKGDTILIGYAGHGMQFGKTCYFCPKDAKPFEDETATLVSLDVVYKKLERSYAGVKLVLVDACRDDGQRGIRGGSADAPAPPVGIGVLLSCSDGEKANEHPDLKHGVFFYNVIKGLEGAARDPDSGEVTWDSLRMHVKRQVPIQTLKLFPDMRHQSPNELGNLSGAPPVLVTLARSARPDLKTDVVEAPKPNIKIDGNQPKPGEERDFDVGHGVKMRFCWIPGSDGKFKVGSPKAEQRYVTQTFFDGKRPDWMDFENEHEVAGLDGFWMAKFTITQSQFTALTGKNPSYFSAEGGGKDKVNGRNTDNFPVEMVSWDDAQACIEGMKVPSGMKKLGLPSEVQWEWAARGGLGNGQPFYWGDKLNGDKANCNGDYPYGTSTKGEYLGRTTTVGSYEQEAKHPWGLCDMAGNVYQWCQDYYGEYDQLPAGKNPVQTVKQSSDRRVLRGGSWGYGPGSCRCAFRSGNAPDVRSDSSGFRVVCLP